MLGVYFAPSHGQKEHKDHIAHVNGETRIMAPDVQHVHDAFTRTGKAIQLRWWEVDDHDGQAARDIRNNPEATARRHAEEFRRRINEMRQQAGERGLTFPGDELIWTMGINEPPIWEHDFRAPFVRYEVALLDIGRDLGLNLLSCRFATSHPADLDDKKQPIWDWLEPVFGAIIRGKHRLDLHEYWYSDGPLTDWAWGWHPGRHYKCPWINDVRVVIGECGIDLYVDEARWIAAGRPQRGWQGHVEPHVYANQLLEYMDACHPNVEVVLPFIADHQAKTWWSFDLLPAYPAINAMWEQHRARLTNRPKPTPTTVHIPVVAKPAAKVPDLVHPVGAIWPISQRFGENEDAYKHLAVDGVALRGHTGIDFAVPTGTPVMAVDAGTVTEAYDDPTGYGQYIKVVHAWGETVYAHLSGFAVMLGSSVHKGQRIGLSGNTGNSSGPHLHLGLRIAPYDRKDGLGGFADPLPYLGASQADKGAVWAVIRAAAQEFKLDPYLLASLAWAESSFRPTVTSSAGAVGLTQLMPDTWNEWSQKVGAIDPTNARDNARTGAAYLAWLLKATGDEREALWAYVWGIGRVLAGKTPPAEVIEYATKILMARDLLKAVLGA